MSDNTHRPNSPITHQTPRPGTQAADLWRRAGVAVVTGCLVTALVPAIPALAEGAPSAPSGSSAPSGTGGGMGGSAPSGAGGGSNTMTFDYTGTYTGALSASGVALTSTSETYTATAADQNAALATNAGALDITGGTFTKSGDDTNGDNCNFYGLNSIMLAVGSGSTIYASNSTLSATSEGSNGIFATNSGTVYAENDTISTTAGNSRGLDATYGGTVVANDMTITTRGDHCAGVATDRGGGDISLTNSSLSTAGSGSPLLYSTGDIEVNNVTGTATGSQIAGMEGLNTILINNSTLESTQTSKTASDPIADGIIIYQSTSGDAESTTGSAATFQAANSTLKSAITSGAMFYFTNTTANVVLSNTTLDFDSTAAKLIEAAGNDSNNWGTAGSNGATVNFTGISETLKGDIDVDTISTLSLYLTQASSYIGKTTVSQNATNTKASSAPLTVNVDSTSMWVVTGDSTVTNLNVAEGGQVIDSSGKTVTIKANGQTVVTGDSSVTVTVTGSYSTTVTTSSANDLSTDLIDRSAFDSHYGTSTTFTLGSGTQSQATQASSSSASSSSTPTTGSSSSSQTQGGSWWDAVVSWFKGIFGM